MFKIKEATCSFDGWQLLKVLANEDTLLRTHCCSCCFLGCANWETFVADTKCFWTKSETFLCPGHKVCVGNKCCARGQTGKHLRRQQCVGNNVSSFARALRLSQHRLDYQLLFGKGARRTTRESGGNRAYSQHHRLEKFENKGFTRKLIKCLPSTPQR